MDIVLLLKSLAGLVVILAIALFLLFYSSKKIKKKETTTKEHIDFKYLYGVIKNPLSSNIELSNATSLIVKDYGDIPAKIENENHPDFDIYVEIIFLLCKHQNIDKNIILEFDKTLRKKNPSYKNEIDTALTKALNLR